MNESNYISNPELLKQIKPDVFIQNNLFVNGWSWSLTHLFEWIIIITLFIVIFNFILKIYQLETRIKFLEEKI